MDEARKRWVLFGIMLSIFLAAMESTVVATAMPTIVAELFGLERRAKMQGYISGLWGFASLIGPWVGGLLTDHVSLRWVFYVNLPFGAVAMAAIATALRGVPTPARRPAMDYPGVVLFAAGVSMLLLGIVEAGRAGSWSGADVIGLLVAAAVALVAFLAVE